MLERGWLTVLNGRTRSREIEPEKILVDSGIRGH